MNEDELDFIGGGATQQELVFVTPPTVKATGLDLMAALKVMGHSSFRHGQEDIVRAVVKDGSRVLAVCPTSFGKSLLYQLPAIVCNGLAIIVSPLISLMKDQVDKLKECGVSAELINSSLTKVEMREVMVKLAMNRVKIAYVAPERFSNDEFVNVMKRTNVGLFAIDECHCISKYGNDFRPAYKRLDEVIRMLKPDRVVALTATATREVRNDILDSLSMPQAEMFVRGVYRPNLCLAAMRTPNSMRINAMLREIRRQREAGNNTGIVYAPTRDLTEKLARVFNGIAYHGGMKDKDRTEAQDKWSSEGGLVVATCAFGMGIDRAQPVTSMVLTPDGFHSMGSIKVGEYVIGANGKPTKIIKIHERGVLPSYEVVFSDGSKTECAEEHIWSVRSAKDKYRDKQFRQIRMGDIKKTGLKDKHGNSLYFIPMTEAVQYSGVVKLPIHPYLLGALIGDGSFGKDCVRFTNANEEMVKILGDLLPDGLCFRERKTYDVNRKSKAYGIVKVSSKCNDRSNKILKEIRDLGLSGCTATIKFIPDIYMKASIEQRIELLRGLFDTDGSARGGCVNVVSYVTVSDRLKDGVVNLVQSIGGVATAIKIDRKKENWNDIWRVQAKFPSNIIPFKVKEKIDVFSPPKKYLPNRSISSIEYVGDKEMRCITVDSDDGLYLTDNFIVTHNCDVRFVYHWGFSPSVEDWYQECGRAGRDGRDADCCSFWDYGDLSIQELLINNSTASSHEAAAFAKWVYKFSKDNARANAKTVQLNMTQADMGGLAFVQGVGACVAFLRRHGLMETLGRGKYRVTLEADWNLDFSDLDKHRERKLSRLKEVMGFYQDREECRFVNVCAYFGDLSMNGACGKCDVCRS